MSLEPRNYSMIAQWAEGASTNIPVPPVRGVSYRNASISEANIRQGQNYDTVWDSSRNNQVNYLVTGLVQQFEQQGFATHSPLTNYLAGVGLAYGSDGVIYIATQNSGPKYGGSQDPVYTTGYWRTFQSAILESIQYATQSVAGIITLATVAEAIAGSNNNKAITPSTLRQALNSYTKDGKGLLPIGKIDLLPFYFNELPSGWYMCNGDYFALTTLQGQALNGLSSRFKSNWNITVSGSNIALPNLFYGDGRGAILRAVNGTSRQPGAWEADQFQGHGHDLRNGGSSVRAGASGEIPNLTTQRAVGGGPTGWQAMDLIAYGSNGTPRIGTETRPLNIGMTPAIYLGV